MRSLGDCVKYNVNITEAGCEKLDIHSSGAQVTFLTQGVTLGVHCFYLAFKSASSDISLQILPGVTDQE